MPKIEQTDNYIKLNPPKFEIGDIIKEKDEEDKEHRVCGIEYNFSRDSYFYEVEFDSAWGQPGKISQEEAEKFEKIN